MAILISIKYPPYLMRMIFVYQWDTGIVNYLSKIFYCRKKTNKTVWCLHTEDSIGCETLGSDLFKIPAFLLIIRKSFVLVVIRTTQSCVCKIECASIEKSMAIQSVDILLTYWMPKILPVIDWGEFFSKATISNL